MFFLVLSIPLKAQEKLVPAAHLPVFSKLRGLVWEMVTPLAELYKDYLEHEEGPSANWRGFQGH